ncbi:PAS domain-containing sensor histidine kinase [Sediminibacterium ginsengisoli]|uniref:histidine kinase n=1 Tax=Sediminibacterium ginsengisoli TaxID=413434 RepID=A0A1T4Q152_9BACT|nr:PAS domain-containing sensor histidine kinase [Sediminibacterium ginsengisoli]SJZ97247.1 PAS domain S-box-containing protein [Sediminibacterium ginsengisoli]
MLTPLIKNLTAIQQRIDANGDLDFFDLDLNSLSTDPFLLYHTTTGRITYCNKAFEKSFGISGQEIRLPEFRSETLIDTEDVSLFNAKLAELGSLLPEERASLRFSCRYQAKEGAEYMCTMMRLLADNLVFIELIRPVQSGFFGVTNKTTGEMLADAEQMLDFGTWIHDRKSKHIYWTDGLKRLTEYQIDKPETAGSIDESYYRSLIIRDDAYYSQIERLREGMRQGGYEVKYNIRTHSGNIKTVLEKVKLEYDETHNIQLGMGIVKDVTDYEKALTSLSEYRMMMLESEDKFHYGLWEYDYTKDEVLWSDGMYRIFGYDPKTDRELVKVDRDIYKKHINEDDHYRIEEQSRKISNGADDYSWEFDITTADGQLRTISTYAKVLRNRQQEAVRVIGTSRDITQLKEYERGLETKIKELNKSNRELESFAYVASHDMQEPLRKISTFGQRLQNKFSEELGEDGRMYIDRMMASAESMRNLIDNLLEFSRITSNNAYEKTDLSQIVQQVCEELDMKIEENQASVDVQVLPVVECISSQMKQLFNNLVNNALKFRSPDRPLQIRIRSELLSQKEVRERHLQPYKKYAHIIVSDNGIGFEQQYADRIFQLFQRLQGKSEYPGTGMGLSISKKIVENHNGMISAESAEDQGATFHIILPYSQ